MKDEGWLIKVIFLPGDFSTNAVCSVLRIPELIGGKLPFSLIL